MISLIKLKKKIKRMKKTVTKKIKAKKLCANIF